MADITYELASSGVYAQSGGRYVDTVATGPTVLEDHESGSIGTLYDGDTADWSIASDTSLEGAQLATTSSTFQRIAHATETTTRGKTYKCRISAGSDDDHMIFLVGVQDSTNPRQNAYVCEVNFGADAIQLNVASGGSITSTLQTTSVTLAAATEYRPRFTYAPTGSDLVFELLDASDTVLATAQGTDDSFTGGTFGFGNDQLSSVKVDYVTEE